MKISNRTTHAVVQGAELWLSLREGFKTASEAPAALGVSKYVTRAELLRQKATGVVKDHSPATLARFAGGHASEAKARPLAEDVVGSELFPVTLSATVDGLDLLASLDGQVLEETVNWETKQWNEELAAHVRAGTLPDHYTVQLDHQLLVSGADTCLFTCTDGTPERFVYCWYKADPVKFERLLAGWRQFDLDLAAYVPTARPEPVIAAPVESLPAVAVRMDGALVVQSNLPAFGVALKEFVGRIPRQPSNDQEFADTEAACKALKRAEDALDAAEANALASLSDVESMRRLVADFRGIARTARLASEKLVDRRKLEVKEQAVAQARRALDAHIAKLNAEIAPLRLPLPVANWGDAIKGLKSMASMQDRLDATLANAKIAADADARLVRENVARYHKQEAAAYSYLFMDLDQIVHKQPDDFDALLQARISAHKVIEARKAAEQQALNERRMEAERQRIRADILAEEDARTAAAVRAAEAAAKAATVPVATVVAPQPPQAAPAPAIQAAAPRADEPATLSLGAIAGRLGFNLTGDFLRDELRIAPAKTDKRAVLFTESQFAVICQRLQAHIGAVAARRLETA